MLQVSPVREVYFSVRGVNNCKLIVKVIINSESIVGILGQNSGFSSGLSYKYVCAANKTKGNNKEKSVMPLCANLVAYFAHLHPKPLVLHWRQETFCVDLITYLTYVEDFV